MIFVMVWVEMKFSFKACLLVVITTRWLVKLVGERKQKKCKQSSNNKRINLPSKNYFDDKRPQNVLQACCCNCNKLNNHFLLLICPAKFTRCNLYLKLPAHFILTASPFLWCTSFLSILYKFWNHYSISFHDAQFFNYLRYPLHFLS